MQCRWLILDRCITKVSILNPRGPTLPAVVTSATWRTDRRPPADISVSLSDKGQYSQILLKWETWNTNKIGKVFFLLTFHEGIEWSGGISPPFLTSALEGGELSALRTDRFTPGEIALFTHWIGGCVGSSAGLGVLGTRKTSCPWWDLNLRSSSP
jgi:hypothetical protein